MEVIQSLIKHVLWNLVRRRDIAAHFLQRAAQYMLLNAEAIKLESVWELLRAAAAAAGPNTNLYHEIIETINVMKSDAVRHALHAFKAWLLVSYLVNKDTHMPGTNSIMINFMLNLHRQRLLEYVLVPTEKEDDAQLFQGAT